ncbi:hypothetical protein [Aeromonas sp. R4-3]|uniref:hypothetical protein n=1 Tax=Aeromonas sp. R4-3 TaxID=3138466 RepID=UPI0034A332A9
MTTNNQATVSYKETTTISADGKVTHQQETKVVGNPTSPEVRELMEKVSDCSGLIIPDTVLGGTVATMT